MKKSSDDSESTHPELDQRLTGVQIRHADGTVSYGVYPNPLIDRVDGNEQVWMPSAWFEAEFGIPSSRVRKAAERNTLPKRDYKGKVQYHVPTARELWPDDMSDGA